MNNFPTVIAIGIALYLIAGFIWTKYQLWRLPSGIGGGDIFSPYSLSLYPRWPIPKKQWVIQIVFWLPIVLVQLLTMLSMFITIGSVLFLSLLATTEEKITPN